MAKHAWFDRLWALTHPGVGGGTEGLVLSGGGSRASFQIGALRYLYDVRHIAPTSIVGTSAGSIVGAMLAQSLDPVIQSEQLRVLENFWLAMTGPEEMYAEQTWFRRLREQWDDLSEVLPEPAPTAEAFVDPDTADPERAVKEALEYDPSTEGSDFSLSVAWQLLGSLPRLGRVGAGLASTLRGAERAASAYRPGPIVHRLLFESGFRAQAVRDSGVQLRLAIVGLGSGALRYIRQDGLIVDTDDQPVEPTPFDLSLGVWASCAIPGVFRPIKLGNELYVDGGVRETVPVEMAVEQLGVTRPYVIVSTPPDLALPDFEPRDMVSIMMRSFSILMDETVRDEVVWARRAGATVIDPRIEVHGSLTVDRGLLRINRDYGWMRAAEELTGAEDSPVDEIIEARLELYRLVGDHSAPAKAVRAARKHLRRLLVDADPALLPDGTDDWPDETPAHPEPR
ncbi:MAG: patatin-like phospholipase family protein [Propionibacteriaceae bacterium]|nr:patatin-like phospholipase family protein [Propionibacteriaceae bacterium]